MLIKRYAWAILATEHGGRQTFIPPLPTLYGSRALARGVIAKLRRIYRRGHCTLGLKSVQPVKVKVEIVEVVE